MRMITIGRKSSKSHRAERTQLSRCFLLVVLAVLVAVPCNALPELYGGARDNDFGPPPTRFMSINAATGNGTTIGAGVGAYRNFTGLEYDPSSGKFYALLETNSSVRVLATIDEMTGLATTVGSMGAGFDSPFDLAIDASGTLYTNLVSTQTLHTVDKVTGALSPALGSLGRTVTGLTFDDVGTLYGVDLDNSALLTINPSNGTVITSTPAVGPITLTRGLAFAEGKLWGADGGSNSVLLTIIRATAQVTIIARSRRCTERRKFVVRANRCPSTRGNGCRITGRFPVFAL